MTKVIGVDFDNTIACYDEVFSKVSKLLNFLNSNDFSKSEIKSKLLKIKGGEKNWQVLQGKVYGKYMYQAKVFHGLYEFLLLAKLRGDQVYIVSHKSEFGHFDEEKISLPNEAMKWLIKTKIIESEYSPISRSEVFFCSTREKKIQKIIDLNCDIFIDDLEEVFLEKSFPVKIKKFLFNSLISPDKVNIEKLSWRVIAKEIYSDFFNEDIISAINVTESNLNIISSELINGRGNSKIFKLNSKDESYALKIYPDLHQDNRERLKTEFLALNFLKKNGLNVVVPIYSDNFLNWGIFKWEDGCQYNQVDKFFIKNALRFFLKLVILSNNNDNYNNFNLASESCLSGLQIENQLNKRYKKLLKIKDKELNNFLKLEFEPLYSHFLFLAKKSLRNNFNIELDKSFQVLSPSDFGSHNSLIKNKKIVYLDFEYFGWDDPVKFICDFYWHPAMNLDSNLRNFWINGLKEIKFKDKYILKRLNIFLPLYGLRWCLILLNEYLPVKFKNRIHAKGIYLKDDSEIRQKQLEKAKSLLNEIKLL
jgi:hypothetical protein